MMYFNQISGKKSFLLLIFVRCGRILQMVTDEVQLMDVQGIDELIRCQNCENRQSYHISNLVIRLQIWHITIKNI